MSSSLIKIEYTNYNNVSTSSVGTVVLTKPSNKHVFVSAVSSNPNFWAKLYNEYTNTISIGFADYDYNKVNNAIISVGVTWLVKP